DDFLWFPEISLQSNEEAELSALNKQQRLGKQFHLLMENSRDFEEAQKECLAGIRKGLIEHELKEELLSLAQQAFENSDLIQLLQLGNHLDERTIALDEKTRLRPDKIVVGENRTVVIDFKTGEENNKHHQQVNAYCFALQSMKYQNIEGYLYYAGGKGLVAVNRGLF
ncbi:MAG: PD-(D/E)XK nuclease family protein, partial [Fluviicola sp.]|nr:PD-(D/E)XK nuclease family protein [Fluviicola sp.]